MIVRPARERDAPGLLALAAEVEHWFGPMVDEPGFHRAVDAHIRAATALVATPYAGPSAISSGLLGGLLFGADAPTYAVHWLVVAERARGGGVGRALLDGARRRFVRAAPATVEVVTFGADHPGAVDSGARVFYERLGFLPAEAAPPGPEGGSRQVYRLTVD